jgi:curved DNA-binding protein CbpA
MSFQIERGLFMLDFSDYHSILGVPVEADVKEIRKHYLKIARRLHPDSCGSESQSDRQLAGQLLSKLVNPAWEKLSQERTRYDHAILLKLKAQAAARRQVEILGSLAKQLMTAQNFDHFYRNALQNLAESQYHHLDQALEITAQISELNLVYLMRKDDGGEATVIQTRVSAPLQTSAPAPSPAPTPQSAPPPQETLLEQYYRRAEGFVKKGNYAKATLELRDALQIAPNNSRCHSLMGMVYLQQNQATMARIHFDKALTVDSQNQMALEGKQRLERLANKTASQAPAAKTPASKAADRNKPNGSGGLFGGLFGGKKK